MLEARGITYAYPGARTPLYRDFDLAVGPDERVALSAPSGFGKTTLCRMLAGYDRPQKGEILVDGAPLPKRGTCPVQLILQHPETAVDPRMRMSQTLAEAGEVPQRLLDDLGIQKRWLARFPHELSGGELQRFCIARALAATRATLWLTRCPPCWTLSLRRRSGVFSWRKRRLAASASCSCPIRTRSPSASPPAWWIWR